jgi:hypothetical protein
MAVIVDTIKLSFLKLFCIRLDHVGYERTLSGVVTSDIFNDLEVEPDDSTTGTFANYGLGFLYSNNCITCYIRSVVKKAYLPLPDTTVVRLLIRAGSGFFNRTAIEPAGSKQVYQFTNLDRTGGGSDKFLTRNASGVTSDDLFSVSAIAPSKDCLAVIDIYSKDVGNDYRLFDGTGNILQVNYRLGFAAA